MNDQIKKMVLTALGVAVVFVATMFIKIPNTIDGYFNLGDGFIMLFASILDPASSLLIGGLGSALADLASGYAYYFFFTLVIKGLEGFMISLIIKKLGTKARIPAYLLGSCIMVFGYFLAKWILKANVLIALSGIPENIFQSAVGLIIAILAYPIIKKVVKEY